MWRGMYVRFDVVTKSLPTRKERVHMITDVVVTKAVLNLEVGNLTARLPKKRKNMKEKTARTTV